MSAWCVSMSGTRPRTGVVPAQREGMRLDISEFHSRLHPKDRKSALRALRDHLDEGRPHDAVYHLRTDSGEYRWFRALGQAAWDEQGVPTRMAGTVRDITQSVESERELKSAASFLRSVIESQMSCITIVANDGVIETTNRSWLDIINTRPKAHEQERPTLDTALAGAAYLDASTKQPFLELVERVASGGSFSESFTLDLSNDGAHRSFLVTVNPIEGDRVREIVALHDTTEQVHARTALAKANEENQVLALVAEHTDSAIVITDRNVRIEWVNGGFTRITGYTFDEAIGKNPEDLLQRPETDRKTVRKMREGIDSGQGFDVEIVNYNKFGKRYWLDIEVRPIRGADGSIDRFIAIERDITQEKLQTQRLRLLEAAVENANESMFTVNSNGRFVAVNRAACDRLGFSREELLSMHVWDIRPDSTPERRREHWAMITRDRSHFDRSEFLTKVG